jgi:endonuclease YncB( thermonuclease family)
MAELKCSMRIKVLAVIFLSSLLGVSCSGKGDTPPGFYRVSRVIDGDTIELAGGSRVRYIGVNTPETTVKKGREWIYSPRPFALEALSFNRSILGTGKITLEFDEQKKDTYGRILAYVRNEQGQFVNEELIGAGLAYVYTFYPNTKYVRSLSLAQEQAVNDEKGIWLDARRMLEREEGRGMVVEGVVNSVEPAGRYLIFRVAGPDDNMFRGLFPLRNLPMFEELGIDPFEHYKGKRVVFTGISRGGSSFYIDNPYQIRGTGSGS